MEETKQEATTSERKRQYDVPFALQKEFSPAELTSYSRAFSSQDPFFTGSIPKASHIGLTTALMEVSLLVAIFIPNVIAFYSILGAICSGTICLVFPMMVKIKMSEKKWNDKDNIYVVVGMLTMYFICITSIVLGE
mmetsp:Transcript_34113/g.59511  ORF Transcript_34113/g.59511 Transcript_34113/m.59511 type:complete len:136 (-) Transcript_34113:702-1109(-)